MKVFARLYKYTPAQVLDLTFAQVWCLLPDSVEQSIAEAKGREKQAEHIAGAIASLRERTGRNLFTEDEINEEQLELYG